MKYKESDLEDNISNIKALLVYGQDDGKKRILVNNVVNFLNIPKNNIFSFLSSEFKDKQELIFTEALSYSMFGGKKMIILSDATASNTNLIKDLVSKCDSNTFISIIAGTLGIKDSLRMFFEKDKLTACIPCYLDDSKNLDDFIRKYLFDANIEQIYPDAMNYMIRHLGNDRIITKNFLDKIILYTYEKKMVEISDVEKCIPDSGISSIDDFLYSLTSGQLNNTLLNFERLIYEDIHPVLILKKIRDHFNMLNIAILRGNIPNLFYKVIDKFNISIKIWKEKDLKDVFIKLQKIEEETRQGFDINLLLRDFVLKLSFKSLKLLQRSVK